MPRLSLTLADFAPPSRGATLPRLPALERLLARGARCEGPADFRGWALAQAGIVPPARLPLAQVVAGRPGSFALATPVHLVAGLERVLLHPAGLPRLAPGELADIAASFNARLGGDGLELEAVAPSVGLLVLPRAVEAQTHDPAPLAGREAGAWLPSGADGGWLRRLMTEVQMLLQDHPLNAAREARGDPPVNGLWLWGSGGDPLPALPGSLPVLASADAFLRKLWQGRGTVAEPPAGADSLLGRGAPPAAIVTLVLATLAPAPAAALEVAEQRWFAPLERALARGQLDRLDLELGGLALSCLRRDRWRFWRRSLPWHEALA